MSDDSKFSEDSGLRLSLWKRFVKALSNFGSQQQNVSSNSTAVQAGDRAIVNVNTHSLDHQAAVEKQANALSRLAAAQEEAEQRKRSHRDALQPVFTFGGMGVSMPGVIGRICEKGISIDFSVIEATSFNPDEPMKASTLPLSNSGGSCIATYFELTFVHPKGSNPWSAKYSAPGNWHIARNSDFEMFDVFPSLRGVDPMLLDVGSELLIEYRDITGTTYEQLLRCEVFEQMRQVGGVGIDY